jgi:hypothetical protein
MWEIMNCEEPFINIKPLDAAIGVATGDLRLPTESPDGQINNAMRMCWRDVRLHFLRLSTTADRFIESCGQTGYAAIIEHFCAQKREFFSKERGERIRIPRLHPAK